MGRTRRFRGKRTHGRGRKAGRGAGLRGGRGKAGLHKHKYMSLVKYHPDHFGSRGFKRHPSLSRKKNSINLSEIGERLDEFLEKGIAKRDKDAVKVDLVQAGIDKLLGRGRVRNKLVITVPEASARARSKILEAGGTVVTPVEEEVESTSGESGE